MPKTAMIHNYTYRFLHVSSPNDRDVHWAKIPALHSLLSDTSTAIANCDIVVAADDDVMFPHLHLPFEWLLSRWNFTHEHCILMSKDPEWPELMNSRGEYNANAGFLVLQNRPRTLQMLKDWHDCPSTDDSVEASEKFPGCERFLYDFPAEQGAFGEFIRPRYRDVIKEVECDEAMGFPGFIDGCEGVFVRHYTVDKGRLKGAFEAQVLQEVIGAVQGSMMRGRRELVRESDGEM